ncbi:MAG: uroporphyrinogen decarboxylase [Oceanibaculum nanhaiense]|uniref:uroporphyrinogen decarboxylase n=1 Tax=Oceanibaculum nanhaiense TaxID=1909734 RepID=UPI0025A49E10|nr:uroporphyrinogen decarboxylase [Oceanibaculum nanhaiense]MDM7945809.1 uroporphyrinogen decarboxylase [Oceanibaculum nanhaiense]
MAITPGKRMLRALKGERLDKPPFWLMRQAGRYLPEYREIRSQAGGFLDLCFSPKLACEVTLQPIRRYGMDAAILFSDILIVPYGLGQGVAFKEGEGPVLDPVRNASDLSRLSLDGFHERVAPVYETVTRIAEALPKETTLIGFAGSPWTVATYMAEGGGSKEFVAVKRWAYGDPEGFGQLINLLVEATVRYLIRQVEAGAEVLQLFDSWAGALPEPGFRRWCIEPTIRIVAALKARYPDIPIIGFPRGAGTLYVPYATETGIDAVSLDTTVSVAWAAEALQSKLPVQGNLDPILLVAGGDALDREVERILSGFSGGAHIFNLGHGVTQTTPPETVERLARRLRA